MAAARGTAGRTLEWTANNIGAGGNRIARWTRAAGFSGFAQWCGIFLGSALRAQGLNPPTGYAAAINWSGYGTKVNSLAEARPGDILVYGSTHVAMYLGNGRQRQGNDGDGTVGDSGVGSSLGLGPITAIRRPPYRGGHRGITGYEKSLIADGKSPKEAREIAGEGGKSGLGLPGEGAFEKNIGQPGNEAIEGAADAVKGGIDLTKAVIGALENPETLLLNVALVGGGAFLVYYGAALMLGVRQPVAAPVKAAVSAP
jgi:hypothetical protein